MWGQLPVSWHVALYKILLKSVHWSKKVFRMLRHMWQWRYNMDSRLKVNRLFVLLVFISQHIWRSATEARNCSVSTFLAWLTWEIRMSCASSSPQAYTILCLFQLHPSSQTASGSLKEMTDSVCDELAGDGSRYNTWSLTCYFIFEALGGLRQLIRKFRHYQYDKIKVKLSLCLAT
jgi:hypothetical protein